MRHVSLRGAHDLHRHLDLADDAGGDDVARHMRGYGHQWRLRCRRGGGCCAFHARNAAVAVVRATSGLRSGAQYMLGSPDSDATVVSFARAAVEAPGSAAAPAVGAQASEAV